MGIPLYQLRVLKIFGGYNPGEVASWDGPTAYALVQKGLAELTEPVEIQEARYKRRAHHETDSAHQATIGPIAQPATEPRPARPPGSQIVSPRTT
jgi:hypothetical protein